jgi:hypothetical protein
LIRSGPATPIGTWATPMKFSMLPWRVDGSNEKLATCFSSTPVCARMNARRAAALSFE